MLRGDLLRGDHQAHLDDLLAACRSPNAKRAFEEAVAAFRAGAYRASIVATWTAVVFDYLGKLRELDLAGNGEATKVLVDFEHARKNSDVTLAQKLEADVLVGAAEKFELLTPIEHEDLERLRRDRHRCAHPSLLTLDEPYQPSAELARVHMRNAVAHLLSRPPLQGREAWDRIWADIESEYFPKDAELAAQRLHVRMSRARETLVRRLVIELTKALLSKGNTADQERQRAALGATLGMYHEEVEKLLSDKFDSLADLVTDDDLPRLLSYCRHVSLAWGCLNISHQGKLRLFVEQTKEMGALGEAMDLPALAEVVSIRLEQLDDASLRKLATLAKRADVLEHIVRRFENSTRFETFADLRRTLSDEELQPCWTPDQRKRLVDALHANRELRKYMAYSGVVGQVLELCKVVPEIAKGSWRKLFDEFVKHERRRSVALKIRDLFPDFPALPDATTEAEAAATVGAEGAQE